MSFLGFLNFMKPRGGVYVFDFQFGPRIVLLIFRSYRVNVYSFNFGLTA